MCPALIIATIMTANMWKNSLKNVESDSSKILYESLLDFLQRNGTYFLNKPRIIIIIIIGGGGGSSSSSSSRSSSITGSNSSSGSSSSGGGHRVGLKRGSFLSYVRPYDHQINFWTEVTSG